MTENQGSQAPQGPAHKWDMTRRRILFAGGGAVLAAGIGAGVVTTASAGQQSAGKADTSWSRPGWLPKKP